MTRLLTNQIASITELREPQKVLSRAQGKPVAILKNSKPVAYLVPVEALEEKDEAPGQTMERVVAMMRGLRGGD